MGIFGDTAAETAALWRSVDNDFVRRNGFSVGNSSVRQAQLVLLGEQPGAGPFYLAEELVAPAVHEYMTERWPITRALRRRFASIGALPLLETSVSLQSNFFRSPSRDEWNRNVPLALRRRLENFSLERALKIIEAVSPNVVLCLGLTVYDRLNRHLGGKPVAAFMRRDNGRLYCVAEASDVILFGMLHPTGARATAAEKLATDRALIQLLAATT